MSGHAIPALVVGTAAAAATGRFLLAVWRRRDHPAATPMLGLAVTLFASALSFVCLRGVLGVAGTATVGGVDLAGAWLALAMVCSIVGSGLWFLFAIRYTGRGRGLFHLAAAAVVVLWLFVFASVVVVGVGWVGGGSTGSVDLLGALGAGVFRLSPLAVLGALLVVEVALERTPVGRAEAALLSVGALSAAFAPVVAGNFGRPLAVPALVGLAGLAFAHGVDRYPIFGTLPVARVAARDRVVAELSDPVVVVDGTDRVVDLNPAAESAFGTDRSAVRGRPLDALGDGALSSAVDAAPGGPGTVRTDGGRTFEVGVEPVTDARGRTHGRLLVLREVTERRRRERRLGVLNQLLAGVVRRRMAAVADRAGAVDAPGTDPSGVAADVRSETDRLGDLVARIREIERALTEDPGGTTDVARVLRETVDADEAADPTVRVPDDPVLAGIGEGVFRTVVEAVVSEGLGAAPEAGTLAVVETDRGPELRILADCAADDRPAPGTAGESVAVPMARLAVEHVGGSVELDHPDPDAVRLVVGLPAPGSGPESTEDDDPTGPVGRFDPEPFGSPEVDENP